MFTFCVIYVCLDLSMHVVFEQQFQEKIIQRHLKVTYVKIPTCFNIQSIQYYVQLLDCWKSESRLQHAQE